MQFAAPPTLLSHGGGCTGELVVGGGDCAAGAGKGVVGGVGVGGHRLGPHAPDAPCRPSRPAAEWVGCWAQFTGGVLARAEWLDRRVAGGTRQSELAGRALRDSAGWVPMGRAGRVAVAIDRLSVEQDREHMRRLLIVASTACKEEKSVVCVAACSTSGVYSRAKYPAELNTPPDGAHGFRPGAHS